MVKLYIIKFSNTNLCGLKKLNRQINSKFANFIRLEQKVNNLQELILFRSQECYALFLVDLYCIIFMQRKYSEVVNYIPNISNLELKNNNKGQCSNQKLRPVEFYSPNLSPSVFPNNQFKPYQVPSQVQSTTAMNSPTFDYVERRSMPNFNPNPNMQQPMPIMNVENRQQSGQPFRGNSFLNQGPFPRRPNQQYFSNEPIQQFSSPLNMMRTNQADLSLQLNIKKSTMIPSTSPNKIQNYVGSNNQANYSTNLAPNSLNQGTSNTLSNPRQNGKIAQSLIIPSFSSNSRNTSHPDLANIVTLQNSNSQSSADLQSTFSSENKESLIELNSPLLSEPGNRVRKQLNFQNNRKKDDVWKSVDFQTLRNINYQSTLELNRRNNVTHAQESKQKQDNFVKQQAKQFTTNGIEPVDKRFLGDPTFAERQDLPKPLDTKFKKRNQFSVSSNVVSVSDIAKFHEVKEVPKRVFTMDDFEVIQKIGKGAYGDVFLARQKKSRFLIVIKSLSKKKIKQLKIQQLVFRQMKIQMYLSHKHITSLYGVFQDQNKIYLIMQCMPDGSMSSNGKKKISENETAHLVQQVCQGLQYMHRQNIIHRDIKPENLLLNNTYLKIGDFGCAVFGNTLRRTVVGCYAYISPEQFSNNPYDEKIDSWSVGILAYQLLTGKPPYQQKLRKLAQSQIFQQKNMAETQDSPTVEFSQLTFPKDLRLSAESIDFIKRLLDPDPTTRADIKEALRHKFLQKARQYEKYLQSKL